MSIDKYHLIISFNVLLDIGKLLGLVDFEANVIEIEQDVGVLGLLYYEIDVLLDWLEVAVRLFNVFAYQMADVSEVQLRFECD